MSSSRLDPGSRRPPPASRGAGRYCLDCRYTLQGLNSPGECPECGRPFNLSDWSTFTREAKPPTLVARTLTGRFIALALAMILEVGGVWVFLSEPCMLLALLPVWQTVMVWLVFTGMGLDRAIESTTGCVLAGSIIAALLSAATGLVGILIGIATGAVVGLYINYLNLSSVSE